LQVLQVLQVGVFTFDGGKVSNVAQEPLETFLGTNTLAEVEKRGSGQIWRLRFNLFAFYLLVSKKSSTFAAYPDVGIIYIM